MEPAPPAHEAERERIWAQYIIDKLSAKPAMSPEFAGKSIVRLILAFHIQLRWAFGNYKKGGVPGVKQMERMWQTYAVWPRRARQLASRATRPFLGPHDAATRG